VSAGTTVRQVVSNNFAADNVSPDTPYALCLALDYQYVRLDPDPPAGAPVEFVAVDRTDGAFVIDSVPIEYYVGSSPLLTPGAGYDPNSFVCDGTAGWTTTPPADLSTVKAVRARYPHGQYAIEGVEGFQLRASTEIQPNAQVGQDVWMFGSTLRNGVWLGVGEPWDSTVVTPTPDARYPATNGRRDILRIIDAVPFIRKAASESVVSPGVPAGFTLTYSANGSGLIPPTVDGYTIVDTLPAGMTYVPGSASIAPSNESTDPVTGQQTITWVIDDVATNVEHTLTYEAVADPSVEPGTPLTNTAVARYGDSESAPARATVTTATNGYTVIGKTADQVYIPNPTAEGVGSGSWTVTLRSFDPEPQDFTDTIDILPYNGDGRGTSFSGTYTVDEVTGPAGAALPAGTEVYYTTEPPGTLTDDPDMGDNGDPGAPGPIWTLLTGAPPADATAVRVVGPELPPGGTFGFQVHITTEGAEGGDVYVNRAQARAEHTELVMRTSALTTMATFYSAELKKYVRDRNGVWHDANDVTDYPTYEVGEEAPYRIVITNTGRGTLRNFEIEDDLFPEGAFTVAELAPQESESHEFTITLDESHLGTVVNTACAEVEPPEDAVPEPEINCDPAGIEVALTTVDKTMVGDPVPNGDGTYTVEYGITVTRRGVSGIYVLEDKLKYGAGTTIVSTDVVNTDPGDIETNDGWDGTKDQVVVDGAAIGVDRTHVYRVRVVTAVDPQVATTDSSDCSLAGSESGTGFLNTTTLRVDDKTFVDEDC
jgi:uncharacterized repeat protein (TIGR01451 family)